MQISRPVLKLEKCGFYILSALTTSIRCCYQVLSNSKHYVDIHRFIFEISRRLHHFFAIVKYSFLGQCKRYKYTVSCIRLGLLRSITHSFKI
jgi:predicted transcriptional regulator with HTH domain